MAGQDNIVVNPVASGFPATVNLYSGADDDTITVNVSAGISTDINVNGGASSSADHLIVNGTDNADTIAVESLTVTFASTAITLDAVEDLTINGGAGDDTLIAAGISVVGQLQLNGQAGNDSLEVDYPITVGALSTDGGAGSNDNIVINTSVLADVVTVNPMSIQVAGRETVNYTGLDMMTINTQAGADQVTVVSTHTGITNINTAEDADTVIIRNSAGSLNVNSGIGADVLNVRGIGEVAVIDGDAGSDIFNIGSLAADTGGVLTGIQALLTIKGGGDVDTLNVDATGDTAANSGALTNTTVTGLRMNEGIAYEGISDLNIALGNFKDTFAVNSTSDTIATTVTLNTNGGGDDITVGAINGITTINSGDGSDTIRVTPSADGPVDSSDDLPPDNGSAINSRLIVNGGDADQDEMIFTLNFPSVHAGLLTSTELVGLQMLDGVTYGGLEVVSILLNDDSAYDFTIESTHAGETHLTTSSAADTINTWTIAGNTTINGGNGDDTINVSDRTPEVVEDVLVGTPVTLNAIGALLTVNGDGGSDTLNVDERGDTLNNTGTLTTTQLTGLGMAVGISYGTLEVLNIDLARATRSSMCVGLRL